MKKLGKYRYSPFIWGLTGSVVITVLFYLIQLLGMQDWVAPIQFSIDKWYYIVPLILGFGIQMGLFRAVRLTHKVSMGTVAVSGGVSAIGMFMCCLHNLIPLLPFLGFSGIAVFFGIYQDYVFLISIMTVISGIIYMAIKLKQSYSILTID